VSLAMTKDFKTFERYGVIMTPEDKDAALLPRRIGGLWRWCIGQPHRSALISGSPTRLILGTGADIA